MLHPPQGLSNYQIADIYDGIIGGDKNALYKLQQINFKPQIPKYMATYYSKKNNASDVGKDQLSSPQLQPQQINSIPSQTPARDQLFLNILKKGAKLDISGIIQKPRVRSKNYKRSVFSHNQSHNLSHKIENKKQQNTSNQDKEPPNNKNTQINISKPENEKKKQFLPKVMKAKDYSELPKVQSTNIQTAKKNMKLQGSEKSKVFIKQKIDFKDAIHKNKKQRQQLQHKNNEEKQVQMDIISYHNQTKEFLKNITQKFGLDLANQAKYLRRKNKNNRQSLDIKQSHSDPKISQVKQISSSQAQICSDIESQIAQLNALLSKNTGSFEKIQKQRQTLLFQRYIQRYGLQIQQEVQQQADTVEPLLPDDQDNNRYKYSMAKTRQKKWSLVQRTEYQSKRVQSLQESRKASTTVRTDNVGITKDEEDSNRVTVNQRLKNILFP